MGYGLWTFPSQDDLRCHPIDLPLYSLLRYAPAGSFSYLDDCWPALKTWTVKKAAALLAIHLVWMLPLHPQVLPDPLTYSKSDKESATEYLQRNKHQRRAGIIMLVGGIGLASLGASSTDQDASGTNALVYLGSLCAVGSLVLFNSAAKNKNRGEMLLRMQSAPLALSKTKKIPSVGIRVRLGK